MASSSSSTITIFLLIMIVTVSVDYSSADDVTTCGKVGPVAQGACNGFYGYCVTNVLTALRDVTPSMRNTVYSRSFPPDGEKGGVTGTADCVYPNSVDTCQDCLREAKQWLDSSCAASDSGTYVTSVCMMYYSQIPN